MTLSLLAAPAQSAEPDSDAKAAALEEFDQGQVQFERGNYDAAATRFKKAWDLYEDPVYVFNIGLAYEKQARWPLAVRYYEQFLQLVPDSPAAPEARRRLEAARASREALRATIRVSSQPEGAKVELLTGDPATCTTPCQLRVDPGPTTLRVSLSGEEATQARSLEPAETWDVAIDLSDLRDPSGPSTTKPEPEAEVRLPAAPRVDRTPSVVAWAAGGVALGVGVAFAVMAGSDHDEGLELVGRESLSPAERQQLDDLREGVETKSVVADVSFGLAAVGAMVGLVLWLEAPEDEPRVHISGDQVGLGWSF